MTKHTKPKIFDLRTKRYECIRFLSSRGKAAPTCHVVRLDSPSLKPLCAAQFTALTAIVGGPKHGICGRCSSALIHAGHGMSTIRVKDEEGVSTERTLNKMPDGTWKEEG